MGGFLLPQLKLLDGMWFGIDDEWIGPAIRTIIGWGYVRTDLPVTKGVSASRTDFVPDGVGGVLVGLSLRSDITQTISCAPARGLVQTEAGHLRAGLAQLIEVAADPGDVSVG